MNVAEEIQALRILHQTMPTAMVPIDRIFTILNVLEDKIKNEEDTSNNLRFRICDEQDSHTHVDCYNEVQRLRGALEQIKYFVDPEKFSSDASCESIIEFFSKFKVRPDEKFNHADNNTYLDTYRKAYEELLRGKLDSLIYGTVMKITRGKLESQTVGFILDVVKKTTMDSRAKYVSELNGKEVKNG